MADLPLVMVPFPWLRSAEHPPLVLGLATRASGDIYLEGMAATVLLKVSL